MYRDLSEITCSLFSQSSLICSIQLIFKKPKASTDLPVVAPFAFAIQQLGTVNIANLTRQARNVPVLPPTGHQYGLPNNQVWDPNAWNMRETWDYTLMWLIYQRSAVTPGGY